MPKDCDCAGTDADGDIQGEDNDVAEGGDEEGEEDEGPGDDITGQSKHERRQARMRARIAALEEANMGDKDWFMRGEAKGGAHWPAVQICGTHVSWILRGQQAMATLS